MSRRLPKPNRLILPFAALVSALGLAVPVLAQDAVQEAGLEAGPRPQLALMGTVPIYWGEADGLQELISGGAHTHWARRVLEQQFELQPLDFLTPVSLAQHRFLLMAQPRGLAATENVALDQWVRDGGKLLLFADPMMTGPSRFSVGDRRRPHDVTLLSPILAHWGLELQYDAEQEEGLRPGGFGHMAMPVNLPGQIVPAEGRFECVVPDGGLIAHCALGSGEVMMIADAALLDVAGPYAGAAEGFSNLVDHVFGPFGEIAGNGDSPSQDKPLAHGNGPVLTDLTIAEESMADP